MAAISHMRLLESIVGSGHKISFGQGANTHKTNTVFNHSVHGVQAHKVMQHPPHTKSWLA